LLAPAYPDEDAFRDEESNDQKPTQKQKLELFHPSKTGETSQVSRFREAGQSARNVGTEMG
jgi:hypothetical protein